MSVSVDYDANEGGEYGYLTVGTPDITVQIAFAEASAPSDLARLSEVLCAE